MWTFLARVCRWLFDMDYELGPELDAEVAPPPAHALTLRHLLDQRDAAYATLDECRKLKVTAAELYSAGDFAGGADAERAVRMHARRATCYLQWIRDAEAALHAAAP